MEDYGQIKPKLPVRFGNKVAGISRNKTFSSLFILMCVMLLLLPLISSFQDILTKIVMHIQFYKKFQEIIVPYELRVLATLLDLFSIPARSGSSYVQYIKNGRPEVIFLAWNCIGWQSFILLVITLFSGLSGKFTKFSKMQVFLIGILGTYLINMFRLLLVVLVYYLTGWGVGLVFHNYFSNLLSIAWLFYFWYLSYKYVLVENKPIIPMQKQFEI